MTGTLLQVRVPAEAAAEWRRHAKALGMPLGTWLYLRMSGVVEWSPALPVEAKSRTWERILGVMGSGALASSGVPPLARRLGIPLRKVQASLGSMVASKKLIRLADGSYRRVMTPGG